MTFMMNGPVREMTHSLTSNNRTPMMARVGHALQKMMGGHMGKDPLASQTTAADALALLGHGRAPVNVNKGREKGTGEAETLRHYLGLVDAGASADRVMQRLRATHNHQKNTNTKAMPDSAPSRERFSLCCNFGRIRNATDTRVGGRLLLTNIASVDKSILRLFPEFSSPLNHCSLVLCPSAHQAHCS